MKMLRALFLAGSVLFLLCACGRQSEPAAALEPLQAPPEQESPPRQTEAAPAQSVNEENEIQEADTVIRDEDGLPLLTLRITRPDVSGIVEGSAKKAIDRYYDEIYDNENKWWSDGLADFAKENKDAAAEFGSDFIPFTVNESYQIYYSGKAFLSIRRDFETYTGGAHGSHAVYCENFRTDDGSLVTLAELFRDDDYKAALLTRIAEQIREDPDRYEVFDDWENMLDSSFDETHFFIGAEDLTIVYQEYDIAPYSAGAPCFSVSYADISNELSESFLREIYGGKE